MTTQRVTVHCDDGFHEGEPEHIRTFTRTDGVWLIASPGDDLLLGDRPYFDGGSTFAELGDRNTRERRRLECPCGAQLIQRSERLEALLDKLADGGVVSISLRRLNLLVSMQA